MLIREENIESIIPQRKPFIMISNLLEASQLKFESNFFIRNENIFVKKGLLQELALVENIAQTCAAGFGFLNRLEGVPSRIGFLGSISKLKVYSLPKVGSEIDTKVVVLQRLENIYLLKGKSFYFDMLLVECEMKIVVN